MGKTYDNVYIVFLRTPKSMTCIVYEDEERASKRVKAANIKNPRWISFYKRARLIKKTD